MTVRSVLSVCYTHQLSALPLTTGDGRPVRVPLVQLYAVPHGHLLRLPPSQAEPAARSSNSLRPKLAGLSFNQAEPRLQSWEHLHCLSVEESALLTGHMTSTHCNQHTHAML